VSTTPEHNALNFSDEVLALVADSPFASAPLTAQVPATPPPSAPLPEVGWLIGGLPGWGKSGAMRALLCREAETSLDVTGR
jgi:hypothetical protein